MHWFVDFDDTLVIGPVTWALKDVFPKMFRDHHLSYDEGTFAEAILSAQQQSNEDMGEMAVVDMLFQTMGWPDALKKPLVQEVFDNYKPSLFEDAVPFLERMTGNGDKVYILSNNNYAPHIAEQLGIARHFAAIFTPKSCGGVRGKPQRAMWDHLLAQRIIGDQPTELIGMVGDDPWSDGAFSERCNIPCWIIDRMNRFTRLRAEKPYRWATSLAEVGIK
jgi:FMN phosphatase YigB (HAD superfamily)